VLFDLTRKVLQQFLEMDYQQHVLWILVLRWHHLYALR